MFRPRLCLPLSLTSLLTHCGGGSGPAPSGRLPQIINVSAYDPKERQREGRSYSEHDVSALKANGAAGLIARCGKGGVLDEMPTHASPTSPASLIGSSPVPAARP